MQVRRSLKAVWSKPVKGIDKGCQLKEFWLWYRDRTELSSEKVPALALLGKTGVRQYQKAQWLKYLLLKQYSGKLPEKQEGKVLQHMSGDIFTTAT